MDDVIEWILEAHTHYLQTGEILELHHVPRLNKYNKQAMTYELEFLKIAIALWKKLPRTVSSIFAVNARGNEMYLLIGYDPNHKDLTMPEVIVNLTVEQFLRPSKKVRSRNKDMKTTENAK